MLYGAEILAIILFYNVSTEFHPALSIFQKKNFRPTLMPHIITSLQTAQRYIRRHHDTSHNSARPHERKHFVRHYWASNEIRAHHTTSSAIFQHHGTRYDDTPDLIPHIATNLTHLWSKWQYVSMSSQSPGRHTPSFCMVDRILYIQKLKSIRRSIRPASSCHIKRYHGTDDVKIHGRY